jgi:hypothetical protein
MAAEGEAHLLVGEAVHCPKELEGEVQERHLVVEVEHLVDHTAEGSRTSPVVLAVVLPDCNHLGHSLDSHHSRSFRPEEVVELVVAMVPHREHCQEQRHMSCSSSCHCAEPKVERRKSLDCNSAGGHVAMVLHLQLIAEGVPMDENRRHHTNRLDPSHQAQLR